MPAPIKQVHGPTTTATYVLVLVLVLEGLAGEPVDGVLDQARLEDLAELKVLLQGLLELRIDLLQEPPTE